jgi:hypothetical protein
VLRYATARRPEHGPRSCSVPGARVAPLAEGLRTRRLIRSREKAPINANRQTLNGSSARCADAKEREDSKDLVAGECVELPIALLRALRLRSPRSARFTGLTDRRCNPTWRSPDIPLAQSPEVRPEVPVRWPGDDREHRPRRAGTSGAHIGSPDGNTGWDEPDGARSRHRSGRPGTRRSGPARADRKARAMIPVRHGRPGGYRTACRPQP